MKHEKFTYKSLEEIQAKAEKLMFLTHDSLIPYYKEPFIIPV